MADERQLPGEAPQGGAQAPQAQTQPQGEPDQQGGPATMLVTGIQKDMSTLLELMGQVPGNEQAAQALSDLKSQFENLIENQLGQGGSEAATGNAPIETGPGEVKQAL